MLQTRQDPFVQDATVARPARPPKHVVVNALVFAGIEAFARRAGVAPSAEDLRLHAILFTKDDTTIAERRLDVASDFRAAAHA